MTNAAYFSVWLLLTVWAAWFVSRRIPDRRSRIPYYLLILLVPVIGAAAAVIIIGFSDGKRPLNTSDRMIDAIADAHKNKKNTD